MRLGQQPIEADVALIQTLLNLDSVGSSVSPSYGDLSALAGAGLGYGSGALNVGAGDTSVTINADSVQVRLAASSGLEVATGLKIDLADTSLALAAGGVSVNLNATSGLQVSSGLMLADTVAGAGLTIASKVLAVGAGTLITVGADSVGITDGANYQFIGTGAGTSAGWVNLSTLAGAGLTMATGVLAVGATDTSISVAADGISVALNATSGLQVSSGLMLADTVAGAGLTITNKVLAVGAGTLITVGADSVGLSVGSAQYQVPLTGADPYTPAWTATSANPGAAISVLRTDASGYLQLVGLGIGVAAGAANRITIVDGGTIGQAAGPLLTFDDTSNYLSLTGANFGVGTNTPSLGRLEVWGAKAGAGTYNYNMLVVHDTTANAVGVGGAIAFSGDAGSAGQVMGGSINLYKINNTDSNTAFGLRLYTKTHGSDPSARLTIDDGGLVGIGTTGPDRRLDVLDASNPQLRLTQADGTVYTDFQTDASGYLTISPQALRVGINTAPSYAFHVLGDTGIDGNLYFVGAQTMYTTADSLTIAPAADLDLTPGGTARVRLTSGVRLQSDNYASQTTGWSASYAGAGDFRYLYADELHAKAFIADLEQALAGGQIIGKSVAPLASAFTAPAAGGNTTLVVESFKGFDSFKVFVDGDFVQVREFSRSGTSLTIADCWGTVVWVSTDTTAKTQTYTFTRSAGVIGAGTAPGSMAAATVIPAGVLVLDHGTTGNGYLESNAIDGAMAENSPYHQVVSWATHPNTGKTVRTRLGNLKGIFNVANEFGLYAGNGVTDASQYLRISDQAFDLHNLNFKLYDGAVPKVQALSSQGLYVSSDSWGANTSVFAAVFADDATVASLDANDVIIGTPFHGTLTSQRGLHWDNSAAILYLKSDSQNYIKFTGNDLEIYSANTKVIDLDGATATVTVGLASTEHIEVSSTSVKIIDNATVYADLTAGALTLGVTTSEHIAISSTAVQIKDGATVYTDLTAGALTLGDTANEHTLINTTGVNIKDGAVVYAQFAATTTVGVTTTDHVSIANTGISIKDGAVVRGEWQTDGDIFIGSDISAAATTYLSILATAQTYNGEVFEAGDMLIGDNSASKANIFWDKSAARLNFRGGTTTQAYVDTTGALMFGGGVGTLDSSGARIEGDSAISAGRSYGFAISGTVVSGTGADYVAGQHEVWLYANSVASRNTRVRIEGYAPASQSAEVRLAAQGHSIYTASFVLNTSNAGVRTATLSADTALEGTSGLTINGGSSANDDLTLQGTSHATRTTSYVLLQPNGGNVGIGTTGPGMKLDVSGDIRSNQSSTGGLLYLGSDSLSYLYRNGGTLYIAAKTGEAIQLDNGTGDVKIQQNSVTPFTCVGTGAVANTLYLNAGTVTIGGTTTHANYEFVVVNDGYFEGDCSALTFTDRTPYPSSMSEAYAALRTVRGNEQGVDHAAMHPFLRPKGRHDGELGRDLSATVSMLTVVAQDAEGRIATLEARNRALEAQIEALQRRFGPN